MAEHPATAAHAAHTGHGPRPYLAIFFWLLGLTIGEIALYFVPSQYHVLTIAPLMVLALAKATLVAMYYMHLRYDPRRITLGISVALALALFFGLVVTIGHDAGSESGQTLLQHLLA